MNLGENKVPRKRRNIGDAQPAENQVADVTQTTADQTETVEPVKKRGLFGKDKSESKKAKKDRPRKGENNKTADSIEADQNTGRPRRGDRPRKDKAVRDARPRRVNSDETKSAEASMDDLMQDVLLASTNELPDLDSEITIPPSDATVDKYVFDNNIAEHQIRHRRVKETAKVETEGEIVNTISSAGLDLNYLDDTDALLNLDSLVSDAAVDTSMFEKSEEEAFIDALISGTANTSNDTDAKEEKDEFNPIEVTKTVGLYEDDKNSDSVELDTVELEELPTEPVLEEPILEELDSSSDIPTEEPILDELDPIDDEFVSEAARSSEHQTVFEMLQELHRDIEELTRNKCLSEQDLRLELFDDHLGRIEKAGVYDFTLPIYKVYCNGYAIPMNASFEYDIPDGADVEVDFGLRVFIPEGHILSVSAIGELEDKMHVQFEGKHYFNDKEAFAGVRLKVKSLSPLSYLPAKFPTFKGTVIRCEKAS